MCVYVCVCIPTHISTLHTHLHTDTQTHRHTDTHFIDIYTYILVHHAYAGGWLGWLGVAGLICVCLPMYVILESYLYYTMHMHGVPECV